MKRDREVSEEYTMGSTELRAFALGLVCGVAMCLVACALTLRMLGLALLLVPR